jgi:hypothetical protein
MIRKTLDEIYRTSIRESAAKRQREDAELEARRKAKQQPGRDMERLARDFKTDESTGDIQDYRDAVALEATGEDDLEAKRRGAMAMDKLKISGDAFNFDVGQYKRHLELESYVANYDERCVALKATLAAAEKAKDAAAAELKRTTEAHTKAYQALSDLGSAKVNADVLQKRNPRLFGELPDRQELLRHYGALGWAV